MISGQVIKTSIEELKAITRVDLCVLDLEGNVVASTFELNDLSLNLITEFAESPADSQVIGTHHLLKILDEGELLYVLDARGAGEDTYMIGKVS